MMTNVFTVYVCRIGSIMFIIYKLLLSYCKQPNISIKFIGIMSFKENFKSRQREHMTCVNTEPGIYRGKESNPTDLEVVQHCLMGFQTDHLVIQPAK